MPRPLTVLIAPDSFKGSLTSVEVALAVADGWRRARPDDTVLLSPLADGGEGTLVAIEAAGGWEWRTSPATDPIGRPLEARWLQSADRSRAIVELAEASGLSRLSSDERDPIGATTRGTGEVLRAAVDAGVRSITLGIGGSATNDGGAGILEALGVRFSESEADLAGLDPRLGDVQLRIACDVTIRSSGSEGRLRHTDRRRERLPNRSPSLIDAWRPTPMGSTRRAAGRSATHLAPGPRGGPASGC